VVVKQQSTRVSTCVAVGQTSTAEVFLQGRRLRLLHHNASVLWHRPTVTVQVLRQRSVCSIFSVLWQLDFIL